MASGIFSIGRDGHRRSRHSPRTVVIAGALALGMLVALFVPQSASARTTSFSRMSHTRTERAAIGAVGRLMNRERRVHHLPKVHLNHELVVSARRHNLEMASFDEMSHQLPGEAFFANRMTAAGYHWSWAGENIGWNSDMSTAGVVELEQLMYAEKAPNNGHRLNILGKEYRDVGIDVYFDYVHHKVWLTTDFGRR